MFWLLWALLGCAEPPVVQTVAPSVLMPGDEVVITGTALAPDVSVQVPMTDGWQDMPLQEASETKLVMQVPEGTSAGMLSLRLARKGKPVEGAEVAVEVWTPSSETPCRKRHALHARTHLSPRSVEITWQFADRDDVVRNIPGEQLRAIVHGSDQQGCQTIHARTTAGELVLLVDDDGRDLAATALQMAESLKVPLER